MGTKKAYWKLTKFIIPLAFTQIAMDIGEQALNRSLTSSTNAVIELASFGIGFKILRLFTGAIEDFKFVSLVLMKSKKDRRKISLTMFIMAFIGASLMLIVGLTPVGNLIIHDFHDVSEEVGNKATKLICMVSLYPFLDGWAWIHTGILIKYKYSFLCGVAAISDVFGQIITVIILLQTNLKTTNVILIPMFAAYIGVIFRLTVLLISYYKYIACQLPNVEESSEPITSNDSTIKALTIKNILIFWAPLMALRLVQMVSRPLINLFVARDRYGGFTQQDGEKALAVLTVMWPLVRVPTGWLNELRSLEPTFTKKDLNGIQEVTVRQVRIFGICSYFLSQTIFPVLRVGFLSTYMMFLLFWVPDITTSILSNISNLDYSLVILCIVPLKILSFLPITVIIRSMATSWILKIKKTSGLYPSSFIRLGTILAVLFVVPRYGIHGAILGGVALFCGFAVEGIAVVIAAGFFKWKRFQNGESKNNPGRKDLVPDEESIEKDEEHTSIAL